MREVLLECGEQADVPVRIFVHRPPGGAQGSLGGVEVARFAEQEAETLQGERRDSVARGHGFVGQRLGTMDQRFVIVGREPEATVLAVLEMREQQLGNVTGKREVCAVPACLQQLEQRIEQEGMVVEISGEFRLAVLVAGQQPTVLYEIRADEVDGTGGGVDQLRAIQRPAGNGQAADGQRVPRRQLLLIPRGGHALRAPFE